MHKPMLPIPPLQISDNAAALSAIVAAVLFLVGISAIISVAVPWR